ncbi:endonuclease/exonuclease/phosphatase family protein [Tsuneonella sp. YG55]|uniref:Endonuclease/exonuclease/phosphatase family protein n=1 Tax=Tsuneonella litorea TaxID=2976475 RepID=A0A9X2W281_9SPHN|nr:endonuclease/exonuclease/phosphatase family protein [Tsuneonella litorea]MCT2559595.1 endonuclease/exonuclease/phosphatase family protein [Tsuneonella litorea]
MLDRRGLLCAAAALPLASCASVAGSLRANLRVATFNIWHDAENWAARLPLIVQALRESEADVIGLQENLEDSAKALPNQAATIATMLGGYSVHFAASEPPGSAKRYGNAILSRLPVVEEAARVLEPVSDHRTALRTRVLLQGRPIDVVVTHLAWQADAGPVRAQQVADLLAWLPRDGTPLVIMGDFNAPLTAPELSLLGPPRFASALAPGATSTTLNSARGHSQRVIDHVFAERCCFETVTARRIGDRATDGEYPSDHFGVAATLKMV